MKRSFFDAKKLFCFFPNENADVGNSIPIFPCTNETALESSQSENSNLKIKFPIFGQCITSPKTIAAASQTAHFLYVPHELSRQNDILQKCVETGLPLMVERGLFLSLSDIEKLDKKLGESDAAIVECGTPLGYDDVVCDPRILQTLQQTGRPFGLNLKSLSGDKTQGTRYPYRPQWLGEKSFLDSFIQMGQGFRSHFFVFDHKTLTAPEQKSLGTGILNASEQPTTQHKNMLQQIDVSIRMIAHAENATQPHVTPTKNIPYPGWDGHIAKGIFLSRETPPVIAGPCMLESFELGLETGKFLKNLCQELQIPYIFKSSYDKANRTSLGNQRGPGLAQGLEWLKKIRDTLDCPILTDVHTPEQALACADVVDIIQIPAFLFQHKELLSAAASTGKVIQIKKAQWAHAQEMVAVAAYLHSLNCHKVILVERGTLFGYNNLTVDFRNLVDMKEKGHAVVFDATHAVQLPGGGKGTSSGLRHMVPHLSRAAFAVGLDGFFMEVHPNPPQALSDADTQLSFDMAEKVLRTRGWYEEKRVFELF